VALTKILSGGLFSGHFADGLLMADQFRLSANFDTNAATVTSWERPTDANGNNMLFAQLGTGLTESSGVFSFPSTGYYFILSKVEIQPASGDGLTGINIQVTENNSDFVTAETISEGGGSGFNRGSVMGSLLLNITNTTNQKFKMITTSLASGSFILGNADFNRTSITAFRIANSQ